MSAQNSVPGCRVPGCGRRTPKPLCFKHAMRARLRGLGEKPLTPELLEGLRRTRRPSPERPSRRPGSPPAAPPPCRIDDCARPGIASGLCTRHYLADRRR